jgi:hypothetical protein
MPKAAVPAAPIPVYGRAGTKKAKTTPCKVRVPGSRPVLYCVQGGLQGARPSDYADGIAGRAGSEFFMRRLSFVAAVAALASLPAGIALAQTAPNTGTETTTTAPAAATAPAATTTPAAPAAAAVETTTTEPAKPKKKKPAKRLTRQQEIDRSIDRGTVPARYRSQVPREYQQYIPFDKR